MLSNIRQCHSFGNLVRKQNSKAYITMYYRYYYYKKKKEDIKGFHYAAEY